MVLMIILLRLFDMNQIAVTVRRDLMSKFTAECNRLSEILNWQVLDAAKYEIILAGTLIKRNNCG
jgi:hypothetical protein